MPEQSPRYQFPGAIDHSKLRTEQPLDPQLYAEMRLPNPLDPMGNIAAEGQALRSLSSGRRPKWVLLTGWATLGLGSFLLLGYILQTMVAALQAGQLAEQFGNLLALALSMVPALVVAVACLMILVRATWRKS
jgi:hypothetical protein